MTRRVSASRFDCDSTSSTTPATAKIALSNSGTQRPDGLAFPPLGSDTVVVARFLTAYQIPSYSRPTGDGWQEGTPSVQIAYTPEQEELKRELRAYFAELMTPEVQAEASAGETGGPACLEAVRKMGRDGWLGIGWPKEYGGQGRGDMEQFIFSDEAWRAGAPIPFLTINTVGKTIMEYGTEAQKQAFLPKILAGELHFSIGYTEPSAGTDLASLRTSAVKDGDEWRINGQKIYTSLASYADYIWLAARTDPEAPKHKGISIFLVPTTDPGFSYTKIHTMVNASTFNTYYDDVRVGDDAIVYGVNRGWDLIVNQLNYERVSLAPPGMLSRTYDATVRWAQETKGPTASGSSTRSGCGSTSPR